MNNSREISNNYITDEELRQQHPALWEVARKKAARINAWWTPELKEQLRKLRER